MSNECYNSSVLKIVLVTIVIIIHIYIYMEINVAYMINNRIS